MLLGLILITLELFLVAELLQVFGFMRQPFHASLPHSQVDRLNPYEHVELHSPSITPLYKLAGRLSVKSDTRSLRFRYQEVLFYFFLYSLRHVDLLFIECSIRILNLFFDEARLNLLIFTLNQYPISLLGNGLGSMISQFSTYPHNLFLELLLELEVFPFALFICVLSIYILNECSYLHHSLFNGNTDLSVLLKYVFYGYVFSIITSLFSGTLLVNTSDFFLLLAFSILYIT